MLDWFLTQSHPNNGRNAWTNDTRRHQNKERSGKKAVERERSWQRWTKGCVDSWRMCCLWWCWFHVDSCKMLCICSWNGTECWTCNGTCVQCSRERKWRSTWFDETHQWLERESIHCFVMFVEHFFPSSIPKQDLNTNETHDLKTKAQMKKRKTVQSNNLPFSYRLFHANQLIWVVSVLFHLRIITHSHGHWCLFNS